MYSRRFEKRPVDHDAGLLMIHAKSYALFRERCPVQKQRKIADIVMLKYVRVAVQRTDKNGIIKHGEKEMFQYLT